MFVRKELEILICDKDTIVVCGIRMNQKSISADGVNIPLENQKLSVRLQDEILD